MQDHTIPHLHHRQTILVSRLTQIIKQILNQSAQRSARHASDRRRKDWHHTRPILTRHRATTLHWWRELGDARKLSFPHCPSVKYRCTNWLRKRLSILFIGYRTASSVGGFTIKNMITIKMLENSFACRLENIWNSLPAQCTNFSLLNNFSFLFLVAILVSF